MSDLLAANRPMMEANAFANLAGVVVTDIQPDFAQAVLEVTPATLNAYGTVHGGAYFTLADVCAGVAARRRARSVCAPQRRGASRPAHTCCTAAAQSAL